MQNKSQFIFIFNNLGLLENKAGLLGNKAGLSQNTHGVLKETKKCELHSVGGLALFNGLC